jgi:hypothetical protein
MRFLGLVSSRLGSGSAGEEVAKECVDLRLGLVNRLVSDNERLKCVTGIVDGLDKFRGKNRVGDFGTLAHDSGPDGELGVIACAGQGDIVAVLAHTLHDILVDNGKDEAVEGAVGHLLRVARAVVRSMFGLVSIEHVGGRLEALRRDGEALEEQGDHVLAKEHEGVVALDERHLEVNKGNVLAARRVRLVLVGLLLAEDVVCGGPLSVLVADLGELLLQDGRVCLGPGLCLASVGACAPEMDSDEQNQEGQNVHFQLEVVHRRALPDAVPCRVRSRADAASRLCHKRGIGKGARGNGCGCRVRSTCVVGKVWGRVLAMRRACSRSRARTIIANDGRGDRLLPSEEVLDKIGHVCELASRLHGGG